MQLVVRVCRPYVSCQALTRWSPDAFDAEYTPPHPGRIQDKKDSIINPLRNNREKTRPKIVKEVANVVNIKDAINQLESEVKDID